MEFENSFSKHNSIATKLATPDIQEALRLMKSTVFGKEQFEVLLDPELLVYMSSIIFIFYNNSTANDSFISLPKFAPSQNGNQQTRKIHFLSKTPEKVVFSCYTRIECVFLS
jgi:hypothetical protein